VLAALPASDFRYGEAQRRAAALDRRVPRLVLRLAPGTPESVTVEYGSVVLTTSSFGLPLPMDPGSHTLRASAAGYESRGYPLTLREGDRAEITVSLNPAAEHPSTRAAVGSSPAGSHGGTEVGASHSAAMEAAVDRVHDKRGRSNDDLRTWAWLTLGLGAANLTVGATTGVHALIKRDVALDQCPNNRCSEVGLEARDASRNLAWVSTVTMVAGVAGAGLGFYLLLRAGETQASLALEPGAISLLGKF
jgi:hypothetical protein